MSPTGWTRAGAGEILRAGRPRGFLLFGGILSLLGSIGLSLPHVLAERRQLQADNSELIRLQSERVEIESHIRGVQRSIREVEGLIRARLASGKMS